MLRTLKNRLLIYFFLVIGFVSCGALFSLIVVSNVQSRTKLLIDKYWQDNNLIAQAHDLLGEVLFYLDLPPESLEATTTREQLRQGIDKLIAAIANSSFQEDFRINQNARLRQLKEDLDASAKNLGKDKQHLEITRKVKKLSTEFRERTELYTRNIIDPTRGMIEESLSLISAVLLASLGIGAMFAASLSIFFAERISLPLDNATAAINRIEKGEIGISLVPTGVEEIDKLNLSVISLAMSLGQTVGGQRFQTNRSESPGELT